MDIQIKIDKSIDEDNIMLTVKKMTPEYSKIIDQIQNISFKLIGLKDNQKYQLMNTQILKIFSVGQIARNNLNEFSDVD